MLLSKTIPVKSIGIVTAASGQQGTIARDAKKAEKNRKRRKYSGLQNGRTCKSVMRALPLHSADYERRYRARNTESESIIFAKVENNKKAQEEHEEYAENMRNLQ